MRPVDPEAVSALLRIAAREEILPRFRRLAAGDVHAKRTDGDPDDVVTAADYAAERRITPALLALLPGSVVVGEEAAAADPSIAAAVSGEAPVWFVDPLDGTKNFASGSERFGVMAALVLRGVTVMAWIHLPVEDVTFAAESGAGATLDGRPFRAAPGAGGDPPSGTVYGRISMPPDELARIEGRATASGRVRPARGSAAIEYTSMLRGAKDYLVYHRLLPWDHAPGALIVAEAGGKVLHADGDAYAPRHRNHTLLAARSPEAWESAHALLFGDGPSSGTGFGVG